MASRKVKFIRKPVKQADVYELREAETTRYADWLTGRHRDPRVTPAAQSEDKFPLHPTIFFSAASFAVILRFRKKTSTMTATRNPVVT